MSIRLFSVLSRFSSRRYESGKTPYPGDKLFIPSEPQCSQIDDSLVEGVPELDQKLIDRLERISLLRFNGEEAVAALRNSIKIANRLQLANVENVAPMYTVWEDQDCELHDDIAEPALPLEKVLSNASVRVEDYFVTPPGNIPLEEASPLDIKLINQWDELGIPNAALPKEIKRTEREK